MGGALSASQPEVAFRKTGIESTIENADASGVKGRVMRRGPVADERTGGIATVSEAVEAMHQPGHHAKNATSLAKLHDVGSALARIIDAVVTERTDQTQLKSTKDACAPPHHTVDKRLHPLRRHLPREAQMMTDASAAVDANHEIVSAIETAIDLASATTPAKAARVAAVVLTASADDLEMKVGRAMVVAVEEDEAWATTKTSVLGEEPEVDTVLVKTRDAYSLSLSLSFFSICVLISLCLEFLVISYEALLDGVKHSALLHLHFWAC
jgi:citrate synthase